MTKSLFARMFVASVVLLLTGSGAVVTAQVKRVQMHIGGYLCGN